MELREIIFNKYKVEGFSIDATIEFAKKYYLPYPDKPIKPILKSNSTSKEALDFANKLKDYEEEISQFELKKELCIARMNFIDSILEDLIKDIANLNLVPEQYRTKVYSLAYSKGHSSGWNEVYDELMDLVEIFK
jgi:hypothetical protein